MKFTASTLAMILLPAATALPATEGTGISARQNSVTDSYLFSISLASFTSYRNARNPATLEWGSDGCSSSPDNPFGFNFLAACHRHDFGYRNYKLQSRFTDAGKLRIDDNFLKDLRYRCTFESPESVCRGLANVYYQAVRAFGREASRIADGAVVADEEAVAAYEKAVAEYNALVTQEQAAGRLPIV